MTKENKEDQHIPLLSEIIKFSKDENMRLFEESFEKEAKRCAQQEKRNLREQRAKGFEKGDVKSEYSDEQEDKDQEEAAEDSEIELEKAEESIESAIRECSKTIDRVFEETREIYHTELEEFTIRHIENLLIDKEDGDNVVPSGARAE